jgi:MoaA/NifB/PqqE/SkfB family radical SAM enzyme
MKLNEEHLLERLQDRPIVIWGARMTGIGFSRLAKRNNLEVVSYVDSDTAFKGMSIGSTPIYKTSYLKKLKKKYNNLIIVVAVALKEDEILSSLHNNGFGKDDYINYTSAVDIYYTIDVVGTCNLKCPSCAWSMDEINYTKGIMSFDYFKLVTEKMKRETELITHVSLYSWGEPFLHPKLDLFINHLHELNIATAVSSNLSIKSSDQIKKIIKASPDYLKISLSGFYPEAYNSTHTGGDINLVKSNLYRIKDYIDKYKSKTFVDVNYHLYRNNNGKNLDKMKELCHELGFALSSTHALVMPLERVLDHCDGKPDDQTKELSKLLLVDIDEGREITKEFRNQPCRFLTNQININWDGSISLCCVGFDQSIYGISNNYLDISLENIWNKKENHPLCDKCLSYGLPAYNLGFNHEGWNAIAAKKTSTDN